MSGGVSDGMGMSETAPNMSLLEAMTPLAGGRLDRADALRKDEAALGALLADETTRICAFWKGKPAVAFGPSGAALALTRLSPGFLKLDPDPVFLGFEPASGAAPRAARFAVDLSVLDDEEAARALWPDPPKFADLRMVGPDLSAIDAEIAVSGRSLLEWRRTHLFCARCGARSEQAMGGWRRDCPACGAKHFPRTDPVVIMLVLRPDPQSGEPRVAIGRQPNWPPGLHSLLAGYVEPGETIEGAVRRETWEEAGLKVGRVRYLSSQPWPYPSTLMIGCAAEAISEEITPDFDELEACRWAPRSELAEALAGRHPSFMAPRTDAIAWALIRAWVDGALPEFD